MNYFNVDLERFLVWLTILNRTKYSHTMFLPVWFKHLCNTKRIKIMVTNQVVHTFYQHYELAGYQDVSHRFTNLPVGNKVCQEEPIIEYIVVYCQDVISKNICGFASLHLGPDSGIISLEQLAAISSDRSINTNIREMQFNYIGALMLYVTSLISYYYRKKTIELLSAPGATTFYDKFHLYGLHLVDSQRLKYASDPIETLEKTLPTSHYFQEKMSQIMRLTITPVETPKLTDLLTHLQTIQKEIEENRKELQEPRIPYYSRLDDSKSSREYVLGMIVLTKWKNYKQRTSVVNA